MPKYRKTEAIWIEKSNRWQIKVQKDGVRKAFYSSTPGRRGKVDAERKADTWLESKYADTMRFGVLWAEFLAHKKDVTGTGNYTNHESIGRLWLLPRLANKRVSAITLKDMQDCMDDGYKKGLSHKSISNIRASITALYTYARKSRIEMERPEGLTIPSDAPVGEREILQPDELEKLFTIDTYSQYRRPIHAHYIFAWRFAVLTGVRPGELYGLKKSDVEGGRVLIKRAVNTRRELTGGKNKRARRWFILTEMAVDVLLQQAEYEKRIGIISPWLFPNENGYRTAQSHAYKTWCTYRMQHGIDSTPYEMRHTMVSSVAADLPEKLLKMIVGHSASMDTQGVYSHEMIGEAERAKKIMDEIFARIFANILPPKPKPTE